MSNPIIDDILHSTDIVDIVGKYVPLKKAGSNFSGCCPFHNEKTPSFMVSPTKQIFKCFGCGKGGNVLTFMQEIEKIDFRDAVKELAKMQHIDLEKYDTSLKKNAAESDEKGKLKRIHTLAQNFFRENLQNHPEAQLMVLLVDERPEEVTDIKEAIVGENVEVIYSTFDELPDRHKRVSEMVIERAKRLVEHGKDVMILLDSITRLARAYNLTIAPSGRTLSGGLDPAALHMPKRFFGTARNIREGGSLTILATALVDTGSRMDDVVFEEFKGTGNMELVLNRKLSEKRIFPAIDVLKSSTRRDDLLLSKEEAEVVSIIRKSTDLAKPEEVAERIIEEFNSTKNNEELVEDIIARGQLI